MSGPRSSLPAHRGHVACVVWTLLARWVLVIRFALEGWKDRQNPTPGWRSRVMWITRICSKCVLVYFGYVKNCIFLMFFAIKEIGDFVLFSYEYLLLCVEG